MTVWRAPRASNHCSPKCARRSLAMKDHRPDVAAGGLLLVDKPRGLMADTLVERVLHPVGTPSIGQTGTHDPVATGLLVIVAGRARRLAPYHDAEPKVNRTRIRFGERTTTDELDGDVVEKAPPPQPA